MCVSNEQCREIKYKIWLLAGMILYFIWRIGRMPDSRKML